jgi:hypothetical protein
MRLGTNSRLMQMRYFLGFALMLAPPALAKDSLGLFGDWGAFKQRGSCYATTASRSDAQGRKASAFLTVTLWAGNRSPQVMVGLGTNAKSAKLSAGGQGFTPSIRGDAAWMPDSRGDQLLIQALSASSSATVSMISPRNNRLTDRYSLKGFNDAWRAAQAGCRG